MGVLCDLTLVSLCSAPLDPRRGLNAAPIPLDFRRAIL